MHGAEPPAPHCMRAAPGSPNPPSPPSHTPQTRTHPGRAPPRSRSRQLDALRRYGRDMTDDARRGLLDPVVGRAAEVSRVLQVLLRRTKNNPVLIGEAGGWGARGVEELEGGVAMGRGAG